MPGPKPKSSIQRDTGFNPVRKLAFLAREIARSGKLTREETKALVGASYSAEACVKRHERSKS